jgi:hypothetical protein
VLVLQHPVLVLVSRVVVLWLSHQRGKKIPSSNAIQFQSHQRKKNGVWRQLCECLSEDAAHLPPIVCQLLLQAWCIEDLRDEIYTHLAPVGFVYLESSWTHAPFVFSSIQPYPPVAIAVFFYLQFSWRSAPLPSCGAFSRHPLLQAFPAPRLLGRGHHSCLLWLACLVTVRMRECSFLSLQNSGSPTLFVACLFFFSSCLFIIQLFFLFSLGEGQSVQGAMLICPREYFILLICSPDGLPSRVGAGVWWRRSPPGFSI